MTTEIDQGHTLTPALITAPLRSSYQINELATALAKAQGLMKHPGKNKTAKVPMKAGGTYSYNYADLADCIDAVRGPFAANGLSFIQVPFNEPGAVGILTRIMHSSGQWIEGTLFMPCPDSKPQSIGSAITYARRYALSPMAGFASDDDDDGNVAQGQVADTSMRVRKMVQEVPGAAQSDRADKMIRRFLDINVSKGDIEKFRGKSVNDFQDADFDAMKDHYDELKKGVGEVQSKLTAAFRTK